MSAQHTATPWRVTLADPIRQPGVLPCIDATDNRGEIACGVLNEALADFIVRACNSHDALLAALDRAATMLERVTRRGAFVVGCDAAAKEARAAIAQGEGR